MFKKIGFAFMLVFMYLFLAAPIVVMSNTPTLELEARCLAWDPNPANISITLTKTTILWVPDTSIDVADYNVLNSFDLTNMTLFKKCLDDPDILAVVGNYDNKKYRLTVTSNGDCNGKPCVSSYSNEVIKLPFGPVPGAVTQRLEPK